MTECMISCTNSSYQRAGSFRIIIANKVDSYKQTANKDHNTANTGWKVLGNSDISNG